MNAASSPPDSHKSGGEKKEKHPPLIEAGGAGRDSRLNPHAGTITGGTLAGQGPGDKLAAANHTLDQMRPICPIIRCEFNQRPGLPRPAGNFSSPFTVWLGSARLDSAEGGGREMPTFLDNREGEEG